MFLMSADRKEKWNISSCYCLLGSDAVFCGKGLSVFRCKLLSPSANIFSARLWKQQDHPNRRNIRTKLHGFIFLQALLS